MTTGKIDRNAVVTQLKGTTGLQPAAPVAKADEVKPSTPENLFGERSPLLDTKTGGDGKAVSTTASAKQLWGQAAVAASNPPLSVRRLKNLPPAQRQQKIEEIKAQMADCEHRMKGRVGELDKKWKYMALAKKTETLKEYLSATPNLTPQTRSEIESAIKVSEDAQAKLQVLRAQVKELRPDPDTGKNGTPEERKELAKKLLAARKAQSEAVTAATEAVDAVGLKIERLALTEDKIDPSGGAGSLFGSLKALIGDYFELSFSMHVLFSMSSDFFKELEQDRVEDAKRKVIEDAWRQRDDAMRQMLADLQVKLDAKGVDVKQNNVSRGTKVTPSAPKAAAAPPAAALKTATKV